MRQIQIKGQNLSREQTEAALNEPPNEWNMKYITIHTPDTFVPTVDEPAWRPAWWEERFGTWHDLTLVGCKIPPSNKSVSPANYHWAVIGFGREASNRIGMDPPYDRIYLYHCFGCPALNGSISMDRHLAAVLQMCSFRFLYKPTNRTINLLNTVADRSRQQVHILPQATSVNIPHSVGRRSRDTRSRQPLYGGRPATSSAASGSRTTRSPPVPTSQQRSSSPSAAPRSQTPTTTPPGPPGPPSQQGHHLLQHLPDLRHQPLRPLLHQVHLTLTQHHIPNQFFLLMV
jgi:hypothetical protein